MKFEHYFKDHKTLTSIKWKTAIIFPLIQTLQFTNYFNSFSLFEGKLTVKNIFKCELFKAKIYIKILWVIIFKFQFNNRSSHRKLRMGGKNKFNWFFSHVFFAKIQIDIFRTIQTLALKLSICIADPVCPWSLISRVFV